MCCWGLQSEGWVGVTAPSEPPLAMSWSWYWLYRTIVAYMIRASDIQARKCCNNSQKNKIKIRKYNSNVRSSQHVLQATFPVAGVSPYWLDWFHRWSQIPEGHNPILKKQWIAAVWSGYTYENDITTASHAKFGSSSSEAYRTSRRHYTGKNKHYRYVFTLQHCLLDHSWPTNAQRKGCAECRGCDQNDNLVQSNNRINWREYASMSEQ